MEFEIHKKYRFDFDYTKKEYDKALSEYLLHLANIDFSKAPSLLKYFGLSFFHDSDLQIVTINSEPCQLTLKVCRNDDKVDLDNFRKLNSLPEINWGDFDLSGLTYLCKFTNVSDLKFTVDEINCLTIIDSEISINNNNKYLISFSFSETENLEFFCSNVSVSPPDKELIKQYSNNLIEENPYCEKCKKKLLTKKLLENYFAV